MEDALWHSHIMEINKTNFKNLYNIDKISNDISEIMANLKTFNPDKQVVAFATKKKHKITLEDIAERLDRIEDILTRNKIDGILERNNLH